MKPVWFSLVFTSLCTTISFAQKTTSILDMDGRQDEINISYYAQEVASDNANIKEVTFMFVKETVGDKFPLVSPEIKAQLHGRPNFPGGYYSQTFLLEHNLNEQGLYVVKVLEIAVATTNKRLLLAKDVENLKKGIVREYSVSIHVYTQKLLR